MTNDDSEFVTRRTVLRAAGATTTVAVAGAAGLIYSTRGASAALTSNTLTGGSVSLSGDGGDVTDFDLDDTTTIDLSWEGFDSDIDSVTFTLEAQRTQVGTGATATEATNNLTPDSGSTITTIFTDTPGTVLSPGRSGNATYTTTDLATAFPFAVIDGSAQGTGVAGTLSNANIDTSSLSLGSDGNYKENEITFTLTADVSAGAQSITVTETGIMSFVVENVASGGDTGGTLDGSGTAA